MLVVVSNKYRDTYKYRRKLNNLGLHFECGKWKLKTSDEYVIESIVRFCRRKKLYYECIEDNYVRSNNYRKKFIEHYEKQKGKYYRCAYCGKKIEENKMTVDHIIPIDKVQHHWIYRKLMKMSGITNINDVSNLTPACEHCNKRKGNKINLRYYIRGILGRKYKSATKTHFAIIIIYLLLVLGVFCVITLLFTDEINMIINWLVKYF
ncbi:HNH endonuclease signature motif containing protein [Ruminococcus sp.]|uniref:HNH endonuclease n=1 Tax=Ruminococcus sp. TaxID=41978 RepID=UPI00262A52D5|nr:HNH endonuclease signature motif containing protein [Ruminococcus sp.]MDD6989952.1 HNH endonuclease signature motif containing protein [Ruminococcus sp.]MDY6201021.1 HNH endonuclease signature motif containing protein [Ruminococcus sp.]